MIPPTSQMSHGNIPPARIPPIAIHIIQFHARVTEHWYMTATIQARLSSFGYSMPWGRYLPKEKSNDSAKIYAPMPIKHCACTAIAADAGRLCYHSRISTYVIPITKQYHHEHLEHYARQY